MSAVINLRHEPKLREELEYAQVVGNTVLIDRRTKWGNPFRICSGQNAEQAVARYRVHLWERIRAGEVTLEDLAELASMLVGMLVPQATGIACHARGACPRGGMGLGQTGPARRTAGERRSLS